jgi:sugar-specific transcriptional regulator TrmB
VAVPDVVQALVELGFNLNEGRAYAALLQLGPSTGYEVSQRTEVPRSAVYGALRRLVAAGAARSIPGNPERFVATPPDALLTVLRKRFDSSTDTFQQAIARLELTLTVPDAFSVRGYERVLEEASRLVHSAERSLVVSGWPRELERLAEELRLAHGRGVYTVLFSHTKLSESLAGVHFSYGIEDEHALEAFWKHRLVMVADDRRSLIGATEQSPGDTAVVSETPAIAELATGQIALDITLLAQRHRHDVTDVMAQLLGDRVGRLDTLLATGPPAVLGEERTGEPED